MQVRHANTRLFFLVCGGLLAAVAAASTPTRAYAGGEFACPGTRCSGNAAPLCCTVTSQILADTAKYYYP